jgi:hypothetical protein
LAVLAVLTLAASSDAAIVTYSWAGTITPNAGDPWALGGAKTFSIGLDVATDAIPFGSGGSFAHFNAVAARLVIDGQNYTAGASTPFLTIIDGIDILEITMASATSPTNIAAKFGTAVVLPTSTFAFSASNPAPPVFGLAFTSGAATTGNANDIYLTRVEANAPVTSTVTPEPSSLTIWALSVLGARLAYRRRQRAV